MSGTPGQRKMTRVGGHARLFAGDASDFGAVDFRDRAARWQEQLRAGGEPECRLVTWT